MGIRGVVDPTPFDGAPDETDRKSPKERSQSRHAVLGGHGGGLLNVTMISCPRTADDRQAVLTEVGFANSSQIATKSTI